LSYKVCPICGTPSHPNAMLCSTCGTSLAEVETVKRDKKPSARRGYDRRYGEADLLEGELHARGRMYLFSAALVIMISLCGIGAFYVGTRVLNAPEAAPTPLSGLPQTPDDSQPPGEFVTTTPLPTILLPTVTPAPPTPTFTPTEGPCTRQVQSGDDLISLLFSCGHRSMDVVPLVLEMNNLSAPEALQAGQTLLIPWPTATGEPTTESTTADVTSAASQGTSEILSVPSVYTAASADNTAAQGDIVALRGPPGEPTAYPTSTLMPGVAWHVIQPNENMLSIAYQYNTNAETLSQLNPEIAFSQCDFQYDSGGERCTVLIQAGQSIRVPAPLPTAALSPTLSGSETATFTPTATFNAPIALSPGSRAQFGRDDLITLRWMGSGLLSSGEVYRIAVEDLTTRTAFTADTSELFYILPASWQGQDAQRHEYRWTVSVIRLNDPEHPTFTTDARLFTWDGRGES
jgi:LysM repeat protein